MNTPKMSLLLLAATLLSAASTYASDSCAISGDPEGGTCQISCDALPNFVYDVHGVNARVAITRTVNANLVPVAGCNGILGCNGTSGSYFWTDPAIYDCSVGPNSPVGLVVAGSCICN
jgi:hypothetical protein